MRDDCAIFLMLFVLFCLGCGGYWLFSSVSGELRYSLGVTMFIGGIIGYLLGVPNRGRA